MKNVKEFSDVILISEENGLFQAHKVVLASTSPFFRKIFNSANYPSLQLRGVNSHFLASLVEVIYDGKRKVSTDTYVDSGEKVCVKEEISVHS